MKHTSGPWHVENVSLDKFHHWSVVTDRPDEGDGDVVCDVVDLNGGEFNAHLIAAAPDLYEACKDAKDKLDEWRVSPAHGDNKLVFMAFQKLEAAIAKAEGHLSTAA